MLDRDIFRNPPSFYRTAPFWSLNDRLEPEELKRQIREFHRMGMGGVFLHPRGGMATEYLSEDYFAAIAACMEDLEKLGMLGWLYDEDRFPSCTAGGKVLKSNPEYAQKVIVMKKGGTGTASAEELLASYSLKGETYARNLTGDIDASGDTLSVVMVQTPKLHRFDLESQADILQKEAIDRFIELTHDRYYKEFKEKFGASIPAIFTDEPNFEPHVPNALPWTPGLPSGFMASYGYDILDKLPELFLNIGDYKRTRYHYWQYVTHLAVTAFSKNIYDWCRSKGIAYTGHFWEHVFPSPLFNGSVMPHYEYMQYPGIDMLFVSNPESVEMYGNDLNVKEVSSVANQLGKERVLSESFGASGWGLNFEYQKRTVDWQLALGINLFSQHLSLYSMKGYRKRDYPLSFLDHQPWWENYRGMADYMGRMSYALAQGKYQADVLVLHPSGSTWANFSPLESSRRLEETGNSVKTLVKNLNQLQIMFDLGDESIMARHAVVEKGTLGVGLMTYSVIILPMMDVISTEVFQLLKSFREQGGTIITTAVAPSLLDGAYSEELEVFFNSSGILRISNDRTALSEALGKLDINRVILTEKDNKDLSNVYTHVRRQGSRKTVFLCNLDMEQAVSLKMGIDTPCRTERFDGETGESCPCEVCSDNKGRNYVMVDLEPLNSALFLMDEDVPVIPAVEESRNYTGKTEKLTQWRIELKDKNAINLQFCRASLNNAPYGPLEDVLKIDDRLKESMGLEPGNVNMRQPWMYSRKEKEKTAFVRAEYPFHVETVPSGEIMAAVELPDIFTVYVNNEEVSPMSGLPGYYKDRAFVLFDIKSGVKKGENVIRLESKEYGVLVNLESVYVVGGFSLKKYGEGFSISEIAPLLPGNIVEQGYPYYSGIISYTSEVDIPEDFSEAVLSFSRFDGVTAVVKFNGEKVRVIGWKPYSADITKHLKRGRNVVEIEIANSLQNLLGPFGGESNLNLVTPGSFYAKRHVKFTPVGFDGEAEILLKFNR